MRKRRNKEEKIQTGFDTFFADFKGNTWRPSDFKHYQRSIYNILCSSYKNTENKINREYIVENFVPEEKRIKFKHTNVYSRERIVKIFQEFFASQKIKGKNTWSISELEERNASLVITLSRKYGYQGKQMVNREACIKEYDLDGLGCIFKRNAPIRTPITMDRVNKELHEIIGKINRGKWSPGSLHKQKPQYLKRLGKKYRDENGKIDWLYIIHKVFNDSDIINSFRHRYSYDRLLKVPKKTKETIQIDQNYGRRDGDSLNPEEIYIQRENEEIKLLLINTIYASIDKVLSDEEKRILFLFLEGNEDKTGKIEEIIEKLKEKLDSI